ncbi:MAG: hypothetical protein M5R40_07200 [Anaerolineae bacterium]|nr:hypothetical protein [Anaerolineae bacterium]
MPEFARALCRHEARAALAPFLSPHLLLHGFADALAALPGMCGTWGAVAGFWAPFAWIMLP